MVFRSPHPLTTLMPSCPTLVLVTRRHASSKICAVPFLLHGHPIHYYSLCPLHVLIHFTLIIVSCTFPWCIPLSNITYMFYFWLISSLQFASSTRKEALLPFLAYPNHLEQDETACACFFNAGMTNARLSDYLQKQCIFLL